jgi:hypothetical protein
MILLIVFSSLVNHSLAVTAHVEHRNPGEKPIETRMKIENKTEESQVWNSSSNSCKCHIYTYFMEEMECFHFMCILPNGYKVETRTDCVRNNSRENSLYFGACGRNFNLWCNKK